MLFRSGLPPALWHTSLDTVIPTLVMVEVWHWTPLVMLIVLGGLAAAPTEPYESARLDGANPWQMFRYITLPLIMPGIVSGAIFAFVTSFDEIVVAIFLSGPYMTTIPVRMFTAVSRELDPTISAVSTIILTITTSLLLVVQVVRRPKEDEPRAA